MWKLQCPERGFIERAVSMDIICLRCVGGISTLWCAILVTFMCAHAVTDTCILSGMGVALSTRDVKCVPLIFHVVCVGRGLWLSAMIG